MSGVVNRISAVLREVVRTELGLRSGEYFPSAVFDKAAAAVAAELPELDELEATKLLLEATREQLSRTIADFCAVRDALPRKQVEQILSAVEDQR